jgi:TonB family protein
LAVLVERGLELKLCSQQRAGSGRDCCTGTIRISEPWIAVLLLVLIVTTLPGSARQAVAQSEGASEYQVKAAYLYNFAKSTEWPKQSLPSGAPLVIGVVGGDDEFIDTAMKTLEGRVAGTHAVVIKRADSAGEMGLCQLAFFRASVGRKRVESALASLGDSSVLSVGEEEGFLREGGMINLLLKNGIVRFDVDRASIERAGLRLSPALLALATSGRGASKGPVADPDASSGRESRRLKVSTPPEYPDIAQKMNIKGAVQVEVSVRPDGTVREVRIIGGHPMLAEALVKAVRRWQYEPAARDSLVVVRFVFGD